MPRVTAIEIVRDVTPTARCDEGFLRLKRLRARNRHADGTSSREYPIDLIDRPTLDAVAVGLWARGPRGVEVLTRCGLRPAAYFRRGKSPAIPEGEYLLVEEIVAGVLEPGEVGLPALQHRAAEEVREETGLDVPASAFQPIGGPFFMLPGVASEKLHLLFAEVARGDGPAEREAPEDGGDGSPLEEGALLRWRRLDDALAACDRGELEDAKTEIAFRRLAARLAVR